MNKNIIKSSEVLICIYQAIKGNRKSLFDPLAVLKNLGTTQSIMMKVYAFKRSGWLVYRPQIISCQMTELGFNKARRAYIKASFKQKKWDGHWWFLVFDVPEKKRAYREKLRRCLIEMNCRKLQFSVWVTPYDIIDELKILLPSFKVGDWLQVIKSREVSNEKELRKIFGFVKKQ